MSQECYIIAHHILSPFGDSCDTLQAIKNNRTGISQINNPMLSKKPFYGAAWSDELRSKFSKPSKFTLLESAIITCVETVLDQYPEHNKKRGILILTSTKGNIDLIEKNQSDIPLNRVNMRIMAEVINVEFNFSEPPILVSNACISGVSALLLGKKLLASGSCDFAVIAGGDVISKFVVSGFQSLMAISKTPCKPYDKSRSGMTPGEGCAAIILSRKFPQNTHHSIRIAGGGQANDANHISGPSRSGEGLVRAIAKALAEANKAVNEIDLINAHGTATIFNDEMESIAFDKLGMETTVLNSLKGYLGHSFAAAGLIETIITAESLKVETAYKTLGFSDSGTSKSLNVTKENCVLKTSKHALKTISGFGGTNAALVLEKVIE